MKIRIIITSFYIIFLLGFSIYFSCNYQADAKTGKDGVDRDFRNIMDHNKFSCDSPRPNETMQECSTLLSRLYSRSFTFVSPQYHSDNPEDFQQYLSKITPCKDLEFLNQKMWLSTNQPPYILRPTSGFSLYYLDIFADKSPVYMIRAEDFVMDDMDDSNLNTGGAFAFIRPDNCKLIKILYFDKLLDGEMMNSRSSPLPWVVEPIETDKKLFIISLNGSETKHTYRLSIIKIPQIILNPREHFFLTSHPEGEQK